MSTTDNLEKLLTEGKDSALLRFGLGNAYFSQQNFQAAVPHLERCMAMDAHYTAAYKLLGRSLTALGEPDKARAVFQQGLDVAEQTGDKQAGKEIQVFLKRLDK